MSSANRHEFLTSHDLQMLERILKQAGFRGTEATVDPDKMGQAARFLIDIFQSGTNSEDELSAALEARGFEKRPRRAYDPQAGKVRSH